MGVWLSKNMWAFWLIVLTFALLWGFFAYLIGRRKGRAVPGFWLGFFLGPIGLIITAILGPAQGLMKKQEEVELDKEKRQARLIAEAMLEAERNRQTPPAT